MKMEGIMKKNGCPLPGNSECSIPETVRIILNLSRDCVENGKCKHLEREDVRAACDNPESLYANGHNIPILVNVIRTRGEVAKISSLRRKITKNQ